MVIMLNPILSMSIWYQVPGMVVVMPVARFTAQYQQQARSQRGDTLTVLRTGGEERRVDGRGGLLSYLYDALQVPHIRLLRLHYLQRHPLQARQLGQGHGSGRVYPRWELGEGG